jgi:hypothetical protein
VAERDLRQRRERRRAGGGEFVDEFLELDVRVGKRLEILGTHAGHEVGHRGCRIDLRPQHQGVDEHADQIAQCGVGASGDRRADHHITRRRQSRDQDRQRRM